MVPLVSNDLSTREAAHWDDHGDEKKNKGLFSTAADKKNIFFRNKPLPTVSLAPHTKLHHSSLLSPSPSLSSSAFLERAAPTKLTSRMSTAGGKANPSQRAARPKGSNRGQAKTKIVVRRLPANLPEHVFMESIKPLVLETSLDRATTWVPGKISKKYGLDCSCCCDTAWIHGSLAPFHRHFISVQSKGTHLLEHTFTSRTRSLPQSSRGHTMDTSSWTRMGTKAEHLSSLRRFKKYHVVHANLTRGREPLKKVIIKWF